MMCKIGILAIGADLYHSAHQHFETLLILLQRDQVSRRVIMDLAAHFLALMTLVLTFRGRVNRQAAGRIVLPVLSVKFMLELEVMKREAASGGAVEDGGVQQQFSLPQILILTKSILFIFITAKLALGKDKSYIGQDEWFPKRQDHAHEC